MRTFRYLVLFLILLLMLALATPPKQTTVYIFLSYDCPICQSATVSLNQLYKKYHPKGVNFIGVFPNYDANPDSVAAFKKKYAIPFGLVLDKKATLTKHFKATITPEVFVENQEKQVLYSGRIDDSYYSLGRRRTTVSSHDLDYALNAITSNHKIKAHTTEAVGCLITLSK